MFYDPRGHVIRIRQPRRVGAACALRRARHVGDPGSRQPRPVRADAVGGLHLRCQRQRRPHARRIGRRLSPPLEHARQRPRSTPSAAPSAPSSAIASRPTAPADLFRRSRRSRPARSYDIRGNLLALTDALGRPALAHTFDLANRPWRIESIDAGIRRTCSTRPATASSSRDSKGAVALHAYEVLNRPSHLWARDRTDEPVTLRERILYGDDPGRGWGPGRWRTEICWAGSTGTTTRPAGSP